MSFLAEAVTRKEIPKNSSERKVPEQVKAYLHEGLIESSNIEFELKLGTVIDQKSYRKPELAKAGRNKIISSYPNGCKYMAHVPPEVFNNLNGYLNGWMNPKGGNVPWRVEKYSRQQDMDVVYRTNNPQAETDKLRASYDLKRGGEEPLVIAKRPLPPLTIFFGGQNELDVRISAAYEDEHELPEDLDEWRIDSIRIKNRISYKMKHFQIDITEVFGYFDITQEEASAMIKNRNYRMNMKPGSKCRIFSNSRQSWQNATVKSFAKNGKAATFTLEGSTEKRPLEKTLKRDSAFIESKDITNIPEISYEVELELLPDVLKNKETRYDVMWDWIKCMFHIRKRAHNLGSQKSRSQPQRHNRHQHHKSKHSSKAPIGTKRKRTPGPGNSEKKIAAGSGSAESTKGRTEAEKKDN
mmetsp:Transcript_11134/g.16676  ORF Transcript_11134/g.16676 Transcript_11134/m.16676 type:complete len:411 (-) Transcript_11134:76-1308(-)